MTLRRAPRHTSNEVVLEAIRQIIQAEPAWGVRKVWATLKRQGLKVSKKRVHALMRAHGLVLARDREPGETTRGHVVVPEPNRRMATDFTTTWTKQDGWVAVVPTIDCGCRSVLGPAGDQGPARPGGPGIGPGGPASGVWNAAGRAARRRTALRPRAAVHRR
ncbi:MAG: IS3 family transposase [Anaeromyxobacter sp.]